MLKQLGFNCNIDEARVLIATQDEDNNGSLELAEFISLIFTDNEALNFSLKRLPGLTIYIYINYFFFEIIYKSKQCR